ncbi:MAG: SAM hydroxide adenosyltransferase, partial [Cyanobacteria bacterium J06659_2]
IQYCDRFGNLVTTIPGDRVPSGSWYLEVGNRKIEGGKTYGDRPLGSLITLIGSHGWVELAVNGGSAEDALGGMGEVRVILRW